MFVIAKKFFYSGREDEVSILGVRFKERTGAEKFIVDYVNTHVIPTFDIECVDYCWENDFVFCIIPLIDLFEPFELELGMHTEYSIAILGEDGALYDAY